MNKYDKQSLRDNIGTYTGSLTGPILDLIDWGIVRRNNRGLRVVAVVKGVHRVNQPSDIGAKRLIAKDWDEGLIWTNDIITVDNNRDYMVVSKNVKEPLISIIIHGSRRSEHLDAGTALALDADDIDRIDPAGRNLREALQDYPGSPRP